VYLHLKGMFVSRVAEDSVCYRAGLRVRDKLVSVRPGTSRIGVCFNDG